MISIGKSPKDVQLELAERFKKQRLLKNMTQNFLSEKSGVPKPTIKKFEMSGEISLKSFIAISHALERLDEIEYLMNVDEPKTLEEVKNIKRQRGRI